MVDWCIKRKIKLDIGLGLVAGESEVRAYFDKRCEFDSLLHEH